MYPQRFSRSPCLYLPTSNKMNPSYRVCSSWCISTPNDTCLNAASHHLSPLNRKLKKYSKVRRVAVSFKMTLPDWRNRRSGTSWSWLYIWSNKQWIRSEIQTPAVHWKLTGRSMSALAVLSPSSIPPPPPPHCAFIPVRKTVDAFHNLISFFTVFEIALAGDLILSKDY